MDLIKPAWQKEIIQWSVIDVHCGWLMVKHFKGLLVSLDSFSLGGFKSIASPDISLALMADFV